MVSEDFIKKEYPLHWYVWVNDYTTLETLLAKNEVSDYYSSQNISSLLISHAKF